MLLLSSRRLSGSNATPPVSSYSCHATLVKYFSPCVFAMSHENRVTPLKVAQKRPCRILLAGCRTLSWPCIYHKIVSRYRGCRSYNVASRATLRHFSSRRLWPIFARHFLRNFLLFSVGWPPPKPSPHPAPEYCVSSRKRRSFEVRGRGGIQEGRWRWGGGKKKEKRTRKKCSGLWSLLEFLWATRGAQSGEPATASHGDANAATKAIPGEQ